VVGAPFDDGDGNGPKTASIRGRAFFFFGSFSPDNVADLTFTGTEDDAQFGPPWTRPATSTTARRGHRRGRAVRRRRGNRPTAAPTAGACSSSTAATTLDTTPDLTLTGDEDDAHFGAALGAGAST
jgi:hypothetical protein